MIEGGLLAAALGPCVELTGGMLVGQVSGQQK